MAEGTTNSQGASKETFHDIEVECDDAVPTKMAVLLKITQLGGALFLLEW